MFSANLRLSFIRSEPFKRICVDMVVTTVYTAAVSWAIMLHRSQINPDGVGYLSVAERWLAGDWRNAINGYWSPLLSWLMVPLLALDIPPLLAARVAQAFSGAIVLAGADRLLVHFGIGRDLRFWTAVGLIPVVLWQSVAATTPDLLMAGVLLWYLAWQTSGRTTSGFVGGLIGGLLIGVAYLAKAYALPFGIMHFAAVNTWGLMLRQQRRTAIMTIAGGALGTCLLVVPWAGLLSWKYNRPMIADTGRYNWQLNGPDNPGQPLQYQGLLAPPHAHAYSAWDDPTYLQMAEWSPWNSPRERAHLWFLLRRNVSDTWTLLDKAVPFLAVWVVGWSVLVWGRNSGVPRRAAAVVAVAVVLYPLGYWFTHVYLRFLLLLVVLAVVFAVTLIEVTSRAVFAAGLVRRSLLGAALAAALAWPMLEPLQIEGKPDPYGSEALAGALRDVIPRGARIASTNPWWVVLYTSYFNGYRYYGVPAPRQTTEHIHRQLREMNVEYVLQWPGRSRMSMPMIAELVGTWQHVRVWRIHSVDTTKRVQATHLPEQELVAD
jgi:hypothetical protein